MKGFETSLVISLPEAIGWIEHLYFQIMLSNQEALSLPGEYSYSYISPNGLEWPKINDKCLHAFVDNYATSVFKVKIDSNRFPKGQYYCTFEAWNMDHKTICKTDVSDFSLGEFDYTKYI